MRFGIRSAVAVSTALLCSSAFGARELYQAFEDVTVPSTFTLEFVGFGDTAAEIAQTNFTLELDPDTGTAALVNYYQEVDALILPGGISTGALTIEVAWASSAGTYNATTGEFATNETYVISFENDLSAFGMTSPALLPGSSTGRVIRDGVDPTIGKIELDWAGSGLLNNPFDPQNPLQFNYTCDVSTDFEQVPATEVCPLSGCDAADVDGDCSIGLGDIAGVLAGFGASGEDVTFEMGDVTGDQVVDLQDLAGVLSQFGTACGS